MSHPEQQYLDILRELLAAGDPRMDRTGVGTRSVFVREMRFDLSDGTLPVFTTKKVLWRWALIEMLWFLRGESNIRALLEHGVTIWSDWPHQRYVEKTGDTIDLKAFERRVLEDDEFARQWGSIGKAYGAMWRNWVGNDGRRHDQVSNAIELLKNSPFSRRIIIEGWNVGELDSMVLPPCHKTYIFGVDSARKLHVHMQQRSVDSFLGLPFNVVGVSVFLHVMARLTGLTPGSIVWTGTDVHLYENHLEQAQRQIAREPRAFPRLRLAGSHQRIEDFRPEDFVVEGYDPHPAIKAPVAV